VRWKLLFITMFAAAVAGAGGCVALRYLLTGSPVLSGGDWPVNAAALLLPVGASIFAGIFVYRHTARRRKLQAALSALLSLALMLAAIFSARALLTTCCEPPTPPLTAPSPQGVS